MSQLGAVLQRRDPRALQRFLADRARTFGNQAQVDDVEGKSPTEMEELLHRMIVARPDLKQLHSASRAWLFQHGIDSYGDGPRGARRN